jgi:hypothetical protein
VARLDVADEALLAVDREMGVALERGQEIARRQLEAPAPEMDAKVALYPSDRSPITISRRPWAVRNASSTSSGVSPRAKRKPR